MKRALFLLFVFGSFGVVYPQTVVTPEQRQQANTYFQAGEWGKAITAYKAIATAEPQNGNARMRWGASLNHTGKTKEAIVLLEEALTMGANAQMYYYLGSAFAKDGNKDKAFAMLDRALTNGFSSLSVFEGDDGYNSIRTDPRYLPLANRLMHGIYPCRYSPEARQFDFWVGEWDVKNPQGQPAGKSKIEIMLGDCVIFENWTSAAPNLFAGKSFNLYNAASKKWMQTWVDDKGGVIEFIDGEYKDNKMVFVTRPNAQKQVTRLSFHNLKPDLVRQHFEVTNDEGKTWTTTTDLYYYRIR